MSDDYDIEKLIELAKSPPTKLEEKLSYYREPSEAHKFVLGKNIKVGTEKISSTQVYYLYKQTTNEPISNIEFGRQFARLFKRNRNVAGTYFLLDPSPFLQVTDNDKKEEPKTE